MLVSAHYMSICGYQTPAWYYQATLWLENPKGVDEHAGENQHTALNGDDMTATDCNAQATVYLYLTCDYLI